jgi:hypothetical protein
LSKLNWYRTSGKEYKLLSSYLKDRYHTVNITNNKIKDRYHTVTITNNKIKDRYHTVTITQKSK